MAKMPPSVPATGESSTDAFLREIERLPATRGGGRGRLLFAMDATASREPTWDHACGIQGEDRKSTRLNSSHLGISYAVFCLKKKKQTKKVDECKIKYIILVVDDQPFRAH